MYLLDFYKNFALITLNESPLKKFILLALSTSSKPIRKKYYINMLAHVSYELGSPFILHALISLCLFSLFFFKKIPTSLILFIKIEDCILNLGKKSVKVFLPRENLR
jgi:hypothetical protein